MKKIWILLLLIFALGFLGCGTDTDNPVQGRQGILELYLTDGPIDAKEVWVTIASVEAHSTQSSWQKVLADEIDVDLLTLKDTDSLIAMTNLPDGQYTSVRFEITGGHVIKQNGERCNLTVPSDKISVNTPFEITQGKISRLTFDFDAEESVHLIQTGQGSEKCILRPVLKSVS